MNNICCNCFCQKPNSESICPVCGYENGSDKLKHPLALPEGTVLAGKYIVGRVLGQGGFGITYIAQDYHTREKVALKEFFPDTVALRSDQFSVMSFSDEKQEYFDYGKECFLSEAETLSRFIGNENICRIYSYFEENNTAYFAMEYIDGESLQSLLDSRGGRISFQEAVKIFLPVTNALSAVHAQGVIHRDISPDNIIITKNGGVKLLDFGAARYSLGDKSRSLDVVLKHGYAPKEQYTRHGRQGPFTDVYSLSATFYKAITGHTPPDSIDRLEEDNLIAPSVFCSDIPERSEEALLKGLAVTVGERYQTVDALRADLVFQPQSAPAPVDPIVTDKQNDPKTKPDDQKENPPSAVIETNPAAKEKETPAKTRGPAAVIAIILVALALIVTVYIGVSSSPSASYEYRVYMNKIVISRYTGHDNDVVIPEKIKGKNVDIIDSNSFSYNTDLRSVTVPDTVTEIDEDAFAGCTGLTLLSIPKHLEGGEFLKYLPENCKVEVRE